MAGIVCSGAVQAIDVRHLGTERVICCWRVDDVLIDPGPAVSLPALLAALDGFEPRAILLTHIHFDHAGGPGVLAARWPGAEIWVHENGARHLAEPRRLVASATRIYGEAEMARLWGPIEPIPAERLRVLAGGETLRGRLPGRLHAGPRLPPRLLPARAVGPGVRRRHGGRALGARGPTIAPTPPPDIDVAAWRRSLDTIAAWQPRASALTHFGPADDLAGPARGRPRGARPTGRAARTLDEEDFVAAVRQGLQAPGDAAAAASFEQASPPAQVWAGLQRYWRKRAEAEG